MQHQTKSLLGDHRQYNSSGIEDDRPTPQPRPYLSLLAVVIAVSIGLGGIGFWISSHAIIYSTCAPQSVMTQSEHPGNLSTPDTASDKVVECGETPEEARARGCAFDPVSFSWLPPLCFDGELVERFLAMRDWQWYYHANDTTSPVPFAEVQKGEHPWLFVTREFHIFHCTYQWRKMHRAMLQGTPVDSYIGNYSHTGHCEWTLTNKWAERSGWDIVDVQISRKFVRCE